MTQSRVSNRSSNRSKNARIQDARLVLYKQKERLGLAGNFDFCLRHATGEFFLLLGDDDVLLPTAIERLVEPFLGQVTGVEPDSVGMVWCPCFIADTEGKQLWITDSGPSTEKPASMIAALIAGNRGSRLSGILVRTKDAIAVGGYEKRHGDQCDLGNWGRAALLRDFVVCVNEPLVQYTNHHASTTSQSSIRQWQEWASIMHADLLAGARTSRDPDAERKIKSLKKNMDSGAALGILIQTIGKPRWIRNAVWQFLRAPGVFFTPYMFRRLLKDGWKLLRLRRNGKDAPQTVSVDVQ